ncbi:MAG: molecular chaperone DnaK, partial [Acidobacteria bacterium]|nr:molecular chaperone DnaK [Acidobacteriota bacterium]
YNVEKSFSENKDKLDSGASGDIEAAISEARTALNGNDTDAMNTAFERLQTASHKIAEVLYNQTGAQGDATGASAEQASSATASGDTATSSTGSDDNVIDAEYVDVDEDKK